MKKLICAAVVCASLLAPSFASAEPVPTRTIIGGTIAACAGGALVGALASRPFDIDPIKAMAYGCGLVGTFVAGVSISVAAEPAPDQAQIDALASDNVEPSQEE